MHKDFFTFKLSKIKAKIENKETLLHCYPSVT